MKYRQKNKTIEGIIIGRPFHEYPVWVHNAIQNKKILIETSVEGSNVILTKIKLKNIYGGVDTGLKDNEYICKGVRNELFLLRKRVFEEMYEPVSDVKINK